MIKKPASIKILGTSISIASKAEILEYVIENALERRLKIPIVTPNPEILVYAFTHKSYQEVLNRAEIAIPDGIGVLISSKILKKGIESRISGVDLMYSLCHEASERGLTVGFLGGRGGVAEKTALCLVKKYPNLVVAFASDEWDVEKIGKFKNSGFENHKNEKGHVIKSSEINYVDILFVAFGFPKQDEWIDQNLEKIPATVAMGVGGAFDYVSGNVKRAPKFIRDAGMEWAFRLVNEPWRIRRQVALPQVALEVLKERFSGSK
mgnify:CR=1 FL=1